MLNIMERVNLNLINFQQELKVTKVIRVKINILIKIKLRKTILKMNKLKINKKRDYIKILNIMKMDLL